MRDVSSKISTLRTAVAESRVEMRSETIAMIRDGLLPKGDPLPVAKVAAIQAAKKTPDLIPYCHSVPIDFVGVTFTLEPNAILIRTEVKAVWKTGVEMEALTAASVAALTIYDMTKMVDDSVTIRDTRLISKRGGKSDLRSGTTEHLQAAVIVLSDSVSAGEKIDTSGKSIVKLIEQEGIEVAEYSVLPDDPNILSEKLRICADILRVDLVLTTGGTGLTPTDRTPEGTLNVLDAEIPGIEEALRAYGIERTPFAMLSRAVAGIRGATLIVNLPGSERGAIESLTAILPALFHASKMVRGEGHAESLSRSVAR